MSGDQVHHQHRGRAILQRQSNEQSYILPSLKKPPKPKQNKTEYSRVFSKYLIYLAVIYAPWVFFSMQ